MSKINILDESIFNKISAGEVVERPASVVKELLDNSIDAKATNITVEIFDGGIKNITITDNGTGIEPDDFDKVFVSHATSKIKTEKDLEKIGTLGFRGEALASIASVSKVKLTSKIETETFARFCSVEGGKQSITTEIGGDNGTKISVSDIFFNVPARAKFLKKPRQEMAEITNLIERYILCNPKVSFKYIADEKLIYQSTGTNLLDAIYIIYGKSAVDGVTKVDFYNPNSEISINGYIGLPTFSKPNRTYQTLSINGRYVNSSLISTCVYNAYEHYLMKGQFPFYVLNINIPVDRLDVNVHPTKMEVRFGNSNEIYGNIYNAVSSALYDVDKITTPSTNLVSEFKDVTGGSSFNEGAEQSFKQTQNIMPKVIEIDNQNINLDTKKQNNNIEDNILKFDIELKNEIQNNLGEKLSNKNITSQKNDNVTKESVFLNSFLKSSSSDMVLSENSSPIMSKLITTHIKNSTENNFEQTLLTPQNDNQKTKTQEFFETSNIKFVGQIFSLYLIVQKDDKVYIIDEHAGHERLLYDRLVKEVDAQVVTKQHLLSPYILSLNNLEYMFLEENQDKLQKLGFDIEPFGKNTYSVNSVPAILIDLDIKIFFDQILKDLSNFKSIKQSDLVLEKLMQHSCKCAVRAGKILSAGEVNSLIEQMKEEKMQLQCPHGRPVVVELTKTEVEKWFKRIV